MMVDGVVGVVRKALEPTAGDQLVNTSPDLTSRGMLTVIVGTIFEYIAGLAVESLTDGFEGGEAYGFGLARLEYREVGGSDTHPLGQLARRHLAPGHHHIYIYYDCHDWYCLYGKVVFFFHLLAHGKELAHHEQAQPYDEQHTVYLAVKAHVLAGIGHGGRSVKGQQQPFAQIDGYDVPTHQPQPTSGRLAEVFTSVYSKHQPDEDYPES